MSVVVFLLLISHLIERLFISLLIINLYISRRLVQLLLTIELMIKSSGMARMEESYLVILLLLVLQLSAV